MLAPARIPVAAGKKMAKTEKKVSPRKSGPMFSHMSEPERTEKETASGQKGPGPKVPGSVTAYRRSRRSPEASWTRWG